jgi:two-component system, cell cycle sensor histidine kinase and response regulator CckA
VIAHVPHLLARTLGEHVALRTELAADLHLVMADAGQIEQVLVNLAVNARDAMPAGGQLTLKPGNISIQESERHAVSDLAPGEYVTLSVTDTGVGIPDEIQDRVCEPFFTTKADGAGTGLGLATVYGIISQAGAVLSIDSEPEIGTTVTAILPAATETREELASAVPRLREGSGQTILVAEDEDALREVIRSVLTRHGYQVLTAADGAQALATLQGRSHHIDALITDVVMPRLPGAELADRARALQPELRVLFMSGYAQGLLDNQRSVESDIHIIEKPFDQVTMLSALSDALGSA